MILSGTIVFWVITVLQTMLEHHPNVPDITGSWSQLDHLFQERLGQIDHQLPWQRVHSEETAESRWSPVAMMCVFECERGQEGETQELGLGGIWFPLLMCSPPTRSHVLCFNEEEQEASGDTGGCEGHRPELLTPSWPSKTYTRESVAFRLHCNNCILDRFWLHGTRPQTCVHRAAAPRAKLHNISFITKTIIAAHYKTAHGQQHIQTTFTRVKRSDCRVWESCAAGRGWTQYILSSRVSHGEPCCARACESGLIYKDKGFHYVNNKT